VNRAMLVEGEKIVQSLISQIPAKWDGKNCIEELKRADYQWRQMEWIGWYFESAAKSILKNKLGGDTGPNFQNVDFDYQLKHVWDLKVHVTKSSKGINKPWAILNDREAITACIEDKGSIGFIICCGIAVFDTDGSFRKWHNALKGEISDYERKRIARGAPSRSRKKSFSVQNYVVFALANPEDIMIGLKDKWLKFFQEGMRNSDGTPRRPKIMVNIDRVPDSFCKWYPIMK
jgi:hypothetical protein